MADAHALGGDHDVRDRGGLGGAGGRNGDGGGAGVAGAGVKHVDAGNPAVFNYGQGPGAGAAAAGDGHLDAGPVGIAGAGRRDGDGGHAGIAEVNVGGIVRVPEAADFIDVENHAIRTGDGIDLQVVGLGAVTDVAAVGADGRGERIGLAEGQRAGDGVAAGGDEGQGDVARLVEGPAGEGAVYHVDLGLAFGVQHAVGVGDVGGAGGESDITAVGADRRLEGVGVKRGVGGRPGPDGLAQHRDRLDGAGGRVGAQGLGVNDRTGGGGADQAAGKIAGEGAEHDDGAVLADLGLGAGCGAKHAGGRRAQGADRLGGAVIEVDVTLTVGVGRGAGGDKVGGVGLEHHVVAVAADRRQEGTAVSLKPGGRAGRHADAGRDAGVDLVEENIGLLIAIGVAGAADEVGRGRLVGHEVLTGSTRVQARHAERGILALGVAGDSAALGDEGGHSGDGVAEINLGNAGGRGRTRDQIGGLGLEDDVTSIRTDGSALAEFVSVATSGVGRRSGSGTDARNGGRVGRQNGDAGGGGDEHRGGIVVLIGVILA